MTINEQVLRPGEKCIFALRQLYASMGYLPYRMSKFEEYDLYASNKEFLVSDNVITFTDTDGKLMALKPDVTLSIIKNSSDDPGVTRKVYYDENVYRAPKGGGAYQEIMQAGVECFGAVGQAEMEEVLTLAARSLQTFSPDAVISLSDLGLLSDLIRELEVDGETESRLLSAIGEKNLPAVRELCAKSARSDRAETLCRLLELSGKVRDVLPGLRELCGDVAPEFVEVLSRLCGSSLVDRFEVDLSVIGDVNYYNGIVFKGFVPGIPEEVLSGGRYDRLMRRLGRRSSAIGFAVYTDRLDSRSLEKDAKDPCINVALPKGRLGEQVYEMFAKAGYPCPSILEPNRKLIFENPQCSVRYFWVKPSDVPIYVERGAADVGVAGKDILLEYSPDVFELADLRRGICRMAVAAPKGYAEDLSRPLRVATKFAEIAQGYYRARGRDIDIIHLNGSIEIAPILGLSDVIVDIVETGTTLRENDLEIIAEILPISARLISNKASFRFHKSAVCAMAEGLKKVTEEIK